MLTRSRIGKPKPLRRQYSSKHFHQTHRYGINQNPEWQHTKIAYHDLHHQEASKPGDQGCVNELVLS